MTMMRVEGRALYCDTNVFIVAVQNDGHDGDLGRRLFDAMTRGSLAVVTSELTLAEVFVHPFRTGDDQVRRAFEILLDPDRGCRLEEVRRSIPMDAARLRGTFTSLKLPDAVHLATAVRSGCVLFLSDDGRMPDVPGLERQTLEGFWRVQGRHLL